MANTKMLGRLKRTRLCPYGCCDEWKMRKHHLTKSNKLREKRDWKKEVWS